MQTRFTPDDTPEEFLAAQRLADVTLPPFRLRALLETAGSPVEVLKMRGDVLQSPPLGLTEKQRERFEKVRAQSGSSQKVLGSAQNLRVVVLMWTDPEYPASLLPFQDAPPLLFVCGTLLPEDALSVGIVGSRRATQYGRTQATHFSRTLVEHGVTIVSGGAAGIDTAAHRAALDAGGRTIAVLGCGPDIAYPAENRKLFEEIDERGAVLSEFAFGTRPEPWRFPTRNRIIAGLSRISLVIEAPHDSGALITARYAGDYGREVWAVPGEVGSGRSRGCHQLIQNGCGLADSPEDLLRALNLAENADVSVPQPRVRTRKASPNPAPSTEVTDAEKPSPKTAEAPAASPAPPPTRLPVPLSVDEENLLAAIGSEPVHLDEAVQAAGLTAQQGAVAATLLEMKALIERQPGNFFIRTL
ncbi:MAG: DNA-processing protein DprA [Armatimonadaceae bacterium]